VKEFGDGHRGNLNRSRFINPRGKQSKDALRWRVCRFKKERCAGGGAVIPRPQALIGVYRHARKLSYVSVTSRDWVIYQLLLYAW
jgi:hypothetical protein